jgi:hypothetical protein
VGGPRRTQYVIIERNEDDWGQRLKDPDYEMQDTLHWKGEGVGGGQRVEGEMNERSGAGQWSEDGQDD